MDTIGLLLSLALTLMVLSYILGDNPLFNPKPQLSQSIGKPIKGG